MDRVQKGQRNLRAQSKDFGDERCERDAVLLRVPKVYAEECPEERASSSAMLADGEDSEGNESVERPMKITESTTETTLVRSIAMDGSPLSSPTMAVGRVKTPTGGFAVSNAGGVDRSLGSESFCDSNQRGSATQSRPSHVH